MPSHPALVGEHDFATAQAITAILVPKHGGVRTYAFVGLLICATCGRRLDSHWANNRPGYRCRHGHSSAKTTTGHAGRRGGPAERITRCWLAGSAHDDVRSRRADPIIALADAGVTL